MFKKVYLCVIAVIVILLPSILTAQAPDTLWTRRYNGPDNYVIYATGCAVDTFGHLFVTGVYTYGLSVDYMTIKYDLITGDTIWTRRYNSPSNEDEQAGGCAVDGLGNLYVTGHTGNGGNDDYLTIKYNAGSGDTIWTRRYSGPGSNNDLAYSCAVDDSGYLYVTGGSYSDSHYDYLTIKYNTVTGDTIWTHRYHALANIGDIATGCAIDASGNLYVTGYSSNGTNNDYLTIKYNTNTGDTLWTRRFNHLADSRDDASGCAVDLSGNLYVTGVSYDDTHANYLTVKYNTATGDTIWTRRYHSAINNDDYASGCAIDGSGNIYVTGYSGQNANWNYLTIKYDATTGNTIWTTCYKDSSDAAHSCTVDGYGNLYVTGVYDNGVNCGYLTIKYNTATGVTGKPEFPMTVSKLKLEQNRPNPFSQHTTISYQLSSSGPASLNIYNAAGQLVKTFNMGQQQAGYHQVEWSDSNTPAGVYFYRLTAGNYQATKKLVVLK
ncbi:MAG: SBBP repeat-containing protein [bacterium]|nr:SBBP repeat-containing protein [bacterium]